MISNNYAWAGKTAILYNVNVSSFVSNPVYDFGFEYVQGSRTNWTSTSIPSNDADWDQSINDKTDPNIYVGSGQEIGLLGSYDPELTPYLVVVKGLTPGRQYTFRTYSIATEGASKVYTDTITITTIANSSSITVNGIDGPIPSDPSEPMLPSEPVITGLRENLRHAIDIINSMCNIEHTIDVTTPTSYFLYGGIRFISGNDPYYSKLIFGGHASPVQFSSVKIASRFGESLMSKETNKDLVKKFMEWATGREDSLWRWKKIFNHPTFGPIHGNRTYEQYDSIEDRYLGHFFGADADMYRIAAAFQVSRSSEYYLYGIVGNSGDSSYTSRYYAQKVNGQYVFRIPYLHNNTFLSNIPYGANQSSRVTVYITNNNGASEYMTVDPISVGTWKLNGETFRVYLTSQEDQEDTHEAVDLGLPSGLLWASDDIKQDGHVLYFAWGETTGYADFTSTKQFKWDYSDYLFRGSNEGGQWTRFQKYNQDDGKYILDLSDDAARVNWGGYWRMPTSVDLQELYEYTDQSIVNGVLRFTNKSDSSKYIDVANVGVLQLGNKITNFEGLYIRSSQLPDVRLENVYALTYNRTPNAGILIGDADKRYLGMRIRPVRSVKPTLMGFLYKYATNNNQPVGNIILTNDEKALIRNALYVDDSISLSNERIESMLTNQSWRATVLKVTENVDEWIYNVYHNNDRFETALYELCGIEQDVDNVVKMMTANIDFGGVRYVFILDDKGNIVGQKTYTVPDDSIKVYTLIGLDTNLNLYKRVARLYDITNDMYVYNINIQNADSREFLVDIKNLSSNPKRIVIGNEEDDTAENCSLTVVEHFPNTNIYRYRIILGDNNDDAYLITYDETTAAPIKLNFIRS